MMVPHMAGAAVVVGFGILEVVLQVERVVDAFANRTFVDVFFKT
jgi:hypothetical protein